MTGRNFGLNIYVPLDWKRFPRSQQRMRDRKLIAAYVARRMSALFKLCAIAIIFRDEQGCRQVKESFRI